MVVQKMQVLVPLLVVLPFLGSHLQVLLYLQVMVYLQYCHLMAL